MLYQLPNGKTIYLSVEEYLDLTPEDIQYYIATGQGVDPRNPHFGSIINGSAPKNQETDYSDDGLDYDPDSDETDTHGPVDLNNLPEDTETNF